MICAAILTLFLVGCNREGAPGSTMELQPLNLKDPTAVDVLRHIYGHVSRFVRPGITTGDIETLVTRLLDQTKAEGYFKGYHKYPSYICASVNDQVVHALPSSRVLVAGDLLKLEIGIRYAGQHAFVAWTFPIGAISDSDARLIRSAQEALLAGIRGISNGVPTSEISKTMDTAIRSAGYEPNSDFVGYQIGELPTMSPQIPCAYSGRASNERLSTGMLLSVLVIVHEGSAKCVVTSNGWNVASKDGKRSVMFSRLVRVDPAGSSALSDFPNL